MQRASSHPEYRQDPVTGRWVVIAPARADRPIEFEAPSQRKPDRECPFCVGHESLTPAASLEVVDPETGNWQVRFVENLFPAFDSTFESLPPKPNTIAAHGIHEVIIESPRHVSRLTELSNVEVGTVFEAYQQRLRMLASDSRIASALLFKNCGLAAGISLEHIHSQLVGLPLVPPILESELRGAREQFAENNGCVFCDVAQENSRRIIETTDRFTAICPYASRFPYETWILPAKHVPHFHAEKDIAELGQFVRRTLSRLDCQIPNAAYNMILHSSPFDNDRYDYYHWHIEIIPRLSTVAGLEWGSGIHVNVVAPETAAERLAAHSVDTL